MTNSRIGATRHRTLIAPSAFRVIIAIMIAIGTVAIASPQAEAKKKAPVDPAVFADIAANRLSQLSSDLYPITKQMSFDMSDDFSAAVADGSVRKVLKLEARYEKRIRLQERKLERSIAKELQQARKVLEKASSDPVYLMQVQDAASAALMDGGSEWSDLREKLAEYVEFAMTEIAS